MYVTQKSTSGVFFAKFMNERRNLEEFSRNESRVRSVCVRGRHACVHRAKVRPSRRCDRLLRGSTYACLSSSPPPPSRHSRPRPHALMIGTQIESNRPIQSIQSLFTHAHRHWHTNRIESMDPIQSTQVSALVGSWGTAAKPRWATSPARWATTCRR